MFTIRFLAFMCLSASLYAQASSAPGDFIIELYEAGTNVLIRRAPIHQGHFELKNIPVGSYSVRLVRAPGETPILEENYRFEPGGPPLVLLFPEPRARKPISNVVSLIELEHPISNKALRDVSEAQLAARGKDFRKAIAKLEHAIQLYPWYGDAHLTLGVQYAITGRTADAHAQFQKALEIGPPTAPIYADLALTSLALGQREEATAFAHQALELDPLDSAAQGVLQTASAH